MLFREETDKSDFAHNRHNFASSATYEELPARWVNRRTWEGKAEWSDESTQTENAEWNNVHVQLPQRSFKLFLKLDFSSQHPLGITLLSVKPAK